MLLVLGLLAQAVTGIARLARRAEGEQATVAPVAVDLVRDPPWRLTLLPGIGLGRAWDIAYDREQEPPYEHVGDLERVRGIGPRTVESIRRTRIVRVLLDGRPVR